MSTTPQSTTDVSACAFRMVNELGYFVSGASRDAGFVTAAKRRTGAVQTILGRVESDRLTVAIFDDAATGRRKLRVTAEATNVSLHEGGLRVEANAPSDDAKRDAHAIVDSCAATPGTTQR